jgi:hypothetical protein
MGLRLPDKNPDPGKSLIWDLLLAPEKRSVNIEDSKLDYFRLTVFEIAVGWRDKADLFEYGLPGDIYELIGAIPCTGKNISAQRMLARIKEKSAPHKLILVKTATEWIIARYLRPNEYWPSRHEAWKKEKEEWENKHPELTPEIRQKYNRIFHELKVRIKSPRICSWERLRQGKDNCEFAGESINLNGKKVRHSPLCAKFYQFLKNAENKKNVKEYFVVNAKIYLGYRTGGVNGLQAMSNLTRDNPKSKNWFSAAWVQYLKLLGVNEDTIIQEYKYGSRLPHCENIGGAECEFNKHTELCRRYYALLDEFKPDELALENLYREWRREYLTGPHKPSFRYPSSADMPVPKIFGNNYHEIDFHNSILKLRLDDMPEGRFLSFGFKPWPADYDFQPGNTEITSVQIHFNGTRARVGFRFKVGHKNSCFSISQDDIDSLRSKQFSRKSDDQRFLETVRPLLLENCSKKPEELIIMTVDLGSKNAAYAIFKGLENIKSDLLKIAKIDALYANWPKEGDNKSSSGNKADETPKYKGLNKEHVGRHLDSRRDSGLKLLERRKKLSQMEKTEISSHDLRRITLHIRWMLRDWVRLNASQIIKEASKNAVDLIIFESMRGFKAPDYDKIGEDEKKRRLAFFAYGKIRRKVAEKAVERGMRVITAPYFFSSKTCSKCGRLQTNEKVWRENKKNKSFECENEKCKFKEDSDKNAAIVLVKVFWGKIKLPQGTKNSP